VIIKYKNVGKFTLIKILNYIHLFFIILLIYFINKMNNSINEKNISNMTIHEILFGLNNTILKIINIITTLNFKNVNILFTNNNDFTLFFIGLFVFIIILLFIIIDYFFFI